MSVIDFAAKAAGAGTPIGVVELDLEELTVRLLEVACSLKRPEGKTNAEMLQGLPPDAVANFANMAMACAAYFQEVCTKVHGIQ